MWEGERDEIRKRGRESRGEKVSIDNDCTLGELTQEN